MSFLDNLNTSNNNPIQDINAENNQNIHLQKLIEEIFKTDNIGIRSDLNQQQILVFAKARLYANTYNVSIINNLLDNYMILALSKNRASRKELVEISKAMKSPETDLGITEKLLGR